MTDEDCVNGLQPPTYATVDHLYNSLDPRRRKPENEEAVVAACYSCNQIRSRLDLIIYTMSPSGTVGPNGGLVIKYDKPVTIRYMNAPQKVKEAILPGSDPTYASYKKPGPLTGKALVAKSFVPRPIVMKGPTVIYAPPLPTRWQKFVIRVRNFIGVTMKRLKRVKR